MTTRLNLASRPFTNRALPWAVTVILVFCSLLALVLIARSTNAANDKAAVVQKEINGLDQRQLKLVEDARQVQNSLTPEQQLLLKSAHELVDRKRFSWSLLFADLEGLLPQSVRVARIAVRQVHRQGDHMVASLELTVIATSPTAVTDMIAAMNKGEVFQAELHTESLQKGRGESGSEYELLVEYTPPASFASTADARAANDRTAVGIGGMR